MNHGLNLLEDGTLEITLTNGLRVKKVIVKDAVMDGLSQKFKPETEEVEELEDCITGGNYKSISIIEPKDCTFNFCSGND